MNVMPAVVLAGGINPIALFEGYTPGYKALLPFRGKPLIEFTLKALRNTPAIQRICIVGPVAQIMSSIADPGAYEFVQAGDSLMQNIWKGVGYFHDSRKVLLIPSDLPLATPRTIQNFLNACGGIEQTRGPAICWSMVPEREFEGNYRMVKKGFNRFRDISVCHGNLLIAGRELLGNRRFVERMDRIYNARKSTIRAAIAIGPLTGFSYLFGVSLLKMLSLSQFARIASTGFGINLIPVRVDDPDIAVDIDEARDYQFVTEELDRREKNQGGDLTLAA
jgi:GTP:adenosylcobinamide-phosphate guanylyltransferase